MEICQESSSGENVQQSRQRAVPGQVWGRGRGRGRTHLRHPPGETPPFENRISCRSPGKSVLQAAAGGNVVSRGRGRGRKKPDQVLYVPRALRGRNEPETNELKIIDPPETNVMNTPTQREGPREQNHYSTDRGLESSAGIGKARSLDILTDGQELSRSGDKLVDEQLPAEDCMRNDDELLNLDAPCSSSDRNDEGIVIGRDLEYPCITTQDVNEEKNVDCEDKNMAIDLEIISHMAVESDYDDSKGESTRHIKYEECDRNESNVINEVAAKDLGYFKENSFDHKHKIQDCFISEAQVTCAGEDNIIVHNIDSSNSESSRVPLSDKCLSASVDHPVDSTLHNIHVVKVDSTADKTTETVTAGNGVITAASNDTTQGNDAVKQVLVGWEDQGLKRTLSPDTVTAGNGAITAASNDTTQGNDAVKQVLVGWEDQGLKRTLSPDTVTAGNGAITAASNDTTQGNDAVKQVLVGWEDQGLKRTLSLDTVTAGNGVITAASNDTTQGNDAMNQSSVGWEDQLGSKRTLSPDKEVTHKLEESTQSTQSTPCMDHEEKGIVSAEPDSECVEYSQDNLPMTSGMNDEESPVTHRKEESIIDTFVYEKEHSSSHSGKEDITKYQIDQVDNSSEILVAKESDGSTEIKTGEKAKKRKTRKGDEKESRKKSKLKEEKKKKKKEKKGTKEEDSKALDAAATYSKHAKVQSEQVSASDNMKEHMGKLRSKAECNTRNDESGEGSDGWDANFDDEGECLNPELLEQLHIATGIDKPVVQKPCCDYYNWTPTQVEVDEPEYEHIVEIYGFSSELKTQDLTMALSSFREAGFDITWVDDTHALGVFTSKIAANQAIQLCSTPLVKVRPLSQGIPESKKKARACLEFLQPYKERPQTTKIAANRMISGALGMQSKMSREERRKEREKLQEAKEQKRKKRQQKAEVWGD